MKTKGSGRNPDPDINVRPEHEMLFLCSRTKVDEVESTRVVELAEAGIDWEYLF